MNSKVILVGLAVVCVVFVTLIVATVAGACWYLYGAISEDATLYLPSTTISYTAVDNGISLVSETQSSKLAALLNTPKIQDLINEAKAGVPADKQALVLKCFLNLSGQSFGALTAVDTKVPENNTGILGFKPKPGVDSFDSIVDDVLKDNPNIEPARDITTGSYNGVDFRCIATEKAKFYIFHTGAWDLVAITESAMHDWVDRYQHKVTTPSLKENAQYQLAVKQLDDRTVLKFFFNAPEVISEHKDEIALSNKMNFPMDQIGALAYGAKVNSSGLIEDRMVFNLPKAARPSMWLVDAPCSYESEKFTTPDTTIYGAATLDLNPAWKNYNDQAATDPNIMQGLQQSKETANAKGFDVEKNVVQALGGDISLQMDWPNGQDFPQGGLFIKIKDAGAFQPAWTALDSSIPNTTAVTVGSANLKVMALPDGPPEYSPCFTTNGPYLAFFSSQDEAGKCLAQTNTLAARPEVGAPGGSGIVGHSSGALFLDVPTILDNVANSKKDMAFLSLAALSNPSYKSLYAFLSDPDAKDAVKALGTVDVKWSWNDDSLVIDSTSGAGCLCSVLGMSRLEYGNDLVH